MVFYLAGLRRPWRTVPRRAVRALLDGVGAATSGEPRPARILNVP
jgi:hypothetical protein